MLKTIFVMILFVSLNCFPEQKMVKIEPVPNESTPSPPPAANFIKKCSRNPISSQPFWKRINKLRSNKTNKKKFQLY